MYYSVCVVCALLVIHLGCGTQNTTTENNCVSDYQEFEKKTFLNNTPNRNKLFQVFYPQNKHSPYAVDVTYQTVLPNGTEANITQEGYCTIIKWRWNSSPVFLYIRTEYLNSMVFFTLYYFKQWTTPSVTLKVPYPCPSETQNLLTQMTSLVDDYALGRLSTNAPSGSVVGVCNRKMIQGRQADLETSVPIPAIFLLSGVFEVILVLIGSVLVLRWNMEDNVVLSYTYSYKHYGLWWGVTYACFIVVPVTLYSDLTLMMGAYPTYGNVVKYPLCVLLLGLAVIPGLIIAGYFTYKTKPPAVPYILMIPVAALLCCCNTQRAKSLVFGTAMWINLIAVTLIMVHGLFILLAGLAEPFAVITNTLVLILVVFCITNILALLFTISAYLFTPKRHRPRGQGKTMLRAVVLIPLLAMIACLCFSIGSVGYLTSRDTKQDGIISFVGSVALPVILGAVTFGLKKLITKWLDKAPNKKQPTRRDFSHDSDGSYEMFQDEQNSN